MPSQALAPLRWGHFSGSLHVRYDDFCSPITIVLFSELQHIPEATVGNVPVAVQLAPSPGTVGVAVGAAVGAEVGELVG